MSTVIIKITTVSKYPKANCRKWLKQHITYICYWLCEETLCIYGGLKKASKGHMFTFPKSLKRHQISLAVCQSTRFYIIEQIRLDQIERQ